MSGGNEFHNSDAATGNVRRPTVVSTAAWVTMTIEVGDGRASQRHEPTDSDMMARDRAARGTPWQPPWSPHAVVDAASAELQGRPWHGRILIILD